MGMSAEGNDQVCCTNCGERGDKRRMDLDSRGVCYYCRVDPEYAKGNK